MGTGMPTDSSTVARLGGLSQGPRVSVEIDAALPGPGDAAQFRAAVERHGPTAHAAVTGDAVPGNNQSLGEAMATRASGLASEIKKDQQYVSKMLEQASRTGDSMQLMKAMVALHDYQIRVQTIAKTVSKATNSFDQLTKLQ